jgi:hypothetical protein
MSRIIQMRGPDAHITGPGRSFFLTSRVFELSRALITSSQTFLAEPAWKDLLNRIWAEDSSDWHPKESLFDIIADVVTLSQEYVNPCVTSRYLLLLFIISLSQSHLISHI